MESMMPELAKPMNKTRIQIDLSTKEVERMNLVMDRCELESRKDLFNNALTLLEWAIHEVSQGFRIASVNDHNKERTILSMSALNNAARKPGV
jgi:hypothetical protein